MEISENTCGRPIVALGHVNHSYNSTSQKTFLRGRCLDFVLSLASIRMQQEVEVNRNWLTKKNFQSEPLSSIVRG